MSTNDFEQINLDKELLIRVGRENDEHVISWDVLKNLGDNLEALIQTIAKHSPDAIGTVNLDNYKLEFSGFYNGSAVPAFKLNSHPTLLLFEESNIRASVISGFSRIMSKVDKGNYQSIADEYISPIAKNEIVRKIYNFTNSTGDIPATIVRRDQHKFQKLYSLKKLKKEIFDKLIVPENDEVVNQRDESIAVAKMIITKNESGKISKKTSEIYKDREAILSLKLERVSDLTRSYVFKSPILFQIYSEGKGTIIENEQLHLYASGKSIIDAKIDLYSQFDYTYNRLNELKDEQLSPNFLQVKQYLSFIIKTVNDI